MFPVPLIPVRRRAEPPHALVRVVAAPLQSSYIHWRRENGWSCCREPLQLLPRPESLLASGDLGLCSPFSLEPL